MRKLLSQVAGAGIGLWLVTLFVPGVVVKVFPDSNFFGFQLTALWQIFLLLGIILGLLNYFVKPVLKIISLPLEILTLGLFSIAMNMALLWFLDFVFVELYISDILSLFYTTLITWVLSIIFKKIISEKD